jgi:hypothetical protein
MLRGPVMRVCGFNYCLVAEIFGVILVEKVVRDDVIVWTDGDEG